MRRRQALLDVQHHVRLVHGPPPLAAGRRHFFIATFRRRRRKLLHRPLRVRHSATSAVSLPHRGQLFRAGPQVRPRRQRERDREILRALLHRDRGNYCHSLPGRHRRMVGGRHSVFRAERTQGRRQLPITRGLITAGIISTIKVYF